MPRVSLLDTPHKGLRLALAELSLTAGATDYTNAREVGRLQARAMEVFAFLEEHADVEETYILPALEQRMPGSTRHDQQDHIRLHQLQQKIEKQLQELPTLIDQPEAAITAGKVLYQNLTRLQAGHLEHMQEEETGTQPLMWDCFSDAELMHIQGQVLATFTPASLMNSLQFILPAQTHRERCLLLKGMRAKATAALMDQVLALAEQVLGTEAYQQLSDELTVPA